MEELVRQGLYPTKSSIVQDAVAIFLDKRGDQQIIQKQLVALLANDPEVRAAIKKDVVQAVIERLGTAED